MIRSIFQIGRLRILRQRWNGGAGGYRPTHGSRPAQNTEYYCNFWWCGCHRRFTTLSALAQHRCRMKKLKEARHRCVKCGKVCALASELPSHMRGHLPKGRYQCVMCSKKYSRFGWFQKHRCPVSRSNPSVTEDASHGPDGRCPFPLVLYFDLAVTSASHMKKTS